MHALFPSPWPTGGTCPHWDALTQFWANCAGRGGSKPEAGSLASPGKIQFCAAFAQNSPQICVSARPRNARNKRTTCLRECANLLPCWPATLIGLIPGGRGIMQSLKGANLVGPHHLPPCLLMTPKWANGWLGAHSTLGPNMEMKRMNEIEEKLKT